MRQSAAVAAIEPFNSNPTMARKIRARYEGYYASVFYSHFAALGLDLAPEDGTSHGRLDPRLRFNGQIWLFEFKVVELAPEGAALAQIQARGYAEKYCAEGLPIHQISIEFSREQRTLVGFEVATLRAKRLPKQAARVRAAYHAPASAQARAHQRPVSPVLQMPFQGRTAATVAGVIPSANESPDLPG